MSDANNIENKNNLNAKSMSFQIARTKILSTIFIICNSIILLSLAIFTLFPFWNTIVISFNQATDTIRGGVYLWPRIFSMQNYKAVFASGTLYQAFFISVTRTMLSVATNIFITTMVAYALSRSEYIFRKPITTVLILSMYVNAGIIPGYFLMKSLGLINNYLVYVIPGMFSAFNFLVIRTYIKTIPESFMESARMDGAGEFRILFSIIFPLCKPVLATIALFVAVGAWNSWFDSFLYTTKQYLSTLQYELTKILASSMSQSKSAADIGSSGMERSATMVTPIAIRAAITVVTSVPILIVYPFLQRHFVKGLNVGGVKE